MLFGRTVAHDELLLLDSLAPHEVLLLLLLISLRDINWSHVLVDVVNTRHSLDCWVCNGICLVKRDQSFLRVILAYWDDLIHFELLRCLAFEKYWACMSWWNWTNVILLLPIIRVKTVLHLIAFLTWRMDHGKPLHIFLLCGTFLTQYLELYRASLIEICQELLSCRPNNWMNRGYL